MRRLAPFWRVAQHMIVDQNHFDAVGGPVIPNVLALRR